MKKKFRNITIDGDDSWAWRMSVVDSFYKIQKLTIWKDKKVVFETGYGYMHKSDRKPYSITPRLIARFIKTYLIS